MLSQLKPPKWISQLMMLETKPNLISLTILRLRSNLLLKSIRKVDFNPALRLHLSLRVELTSQRKRKRLMILLKRSKRDNLSRASLLGPSKIKNNTNLWHQ